MTRILLPSDFSKNSRNAIEYAIYLFEKEPCTFYILNACQISPSGLISTINKERETRLHEITVQESKAKVEKIVDQLKKSNKVTLHKFEGITVSDSLMNALARNIISKNVDFVFMGTQGATGLKEIFMGSNTVSVIKNINSCPIVAVPAIYDYDIPDVIVFATDYRHMFKNAELKPLIYLAKLWGSAIKVVHIAEENELEEEQKQLKKMLQNWFEGLHYSFEDLDYYPNISLRISQLAEDKNVGMIAMINSKHGFFRRLMREPVIKKVAFRTEVPFLVLPEKVK